MALQQPFLSELLHSTSKRSLPTTLTTRSTILSLQQPKKHNLYLHNQQFKKQERLSCYAIAENIGDGISSSSSSAEVDDQSVLLENSSLEELRGQREIVGYDWTEEWYPLYLTKNVPDDAPLGLTVFDKQVVLYKDGSGELRCFEDRCPHR